MGLVHLAPACLLHTNFSQIQVSADKLKHAELTELHSFYSPFNFGPIIINLPIIVSF